MKDITISRIKLSSQNKNFKKTLKTIVVSINLFQDKEKDLLLLIQFLLQSKE